MTLAVKLTEWMLLLVAVMLEVPIVCQRAAVIHAVHLH